MPAFVARYASAFADVVTDARLDAAAIDHKFSDFLATWEGSAELRTFFVNPAAPAVQKVEILDKLNAKLGMQKELRNLLAVLISRTTASATSSRWRQPIAAFCSDSPAFAPPKSSPRAS